MKHAALGFLALVLALPAWATPRSLSADAQRRVDDVFVDYATPETPGFAVGIVKDGELVFACGYGRANLDDGVPIDSASVFHLASVSKQFTAAAIALLIMDGKIRLDDPVSRYIPEAAKYGNGPRIKHLVYMTSGIHEYTSQPRLSGAVNREIALDDAFARASHHRYQKDAR